MNVRVMEVATPMTRCWERGLDYMTQMEQQLITRMITTRKFAWKIA